MDNKPLTEVAFYCAPCKNKFKGEPDETVPAPEKTWHPYDYWSYCEQCGTRIPQANWEKGSLKARSMATGPKTKEGKAASSTNLVGHPTPEEAKITRFNALKHGLYAKVAKYFPAIVGKYPECQSCEHEKTQICKTKFNACLKKTELFMKFQLAFDKDDPAILRDLMAENQAALMGIYSQMLMTVAGEGVMTHQPKVVLDKEGNPTALTYRDSDGVDQPVLDSKAHPLLKVITDMVAKNQVSLGDMNMTYKAQEQAATLKGYLDKEDDDRETTREFQDRQTKSVEQLRGLLERSQERTARDPVLIEHSHQESK